MEVQAVVVDASRPPPDSATLAAQLQEARAAAMAAADRMQQLLMQMATLEAAAAERRLAELNEAALRAQLSESAPGAQEAARRAAALAEATPPAAPTPQPAALVRSVPAAPVHTAPAVVAVEPPPAVDKPPAAESPPPAEPELQSAKSPEAPKPPELPKPIPGADSPKPRQAFALDTTGDGVADSLGFDTTGDGLIDTVQPAPKQSVALDTTGDGVADSLGYDTTGDGLIDTVQRLTRIQAIRPAGMPPAAAEPPDGSEATEGGALLGSPSKKEHKIAMTDVFGGQDEQRVNNSLKWVRDTSKRPTFKSSNMSSVGAEGSLDKEQEGGQLGAPAPPEAVDPPPPRGSPARARARVCRHSRGQAR